MLATNLDQIADLVSKIGSSDFGPGYFELFDETFAIEQCTVFAFDPQGQPTSVLAEVKSSSMREIATALAQDYVNDGFSRDPTLELASHVASPFIHVRRADDLTDPAYRRRFYDDPHIEHELVLFGCANNITYYSSFYRGPHEAPFTAEDVATMRLLSNFALKTLSRHFEVHGIVSSHGAPHAATPTADTRISSCASRGDTLAHLRNILLNEGNGLSPREAEVCAAIVLGYSTLAISLNCNISVNTVATHRKRAYAKLGICSQNELFARYFQTVARFNQ